MFSVFAPDETRRLLQNILCIYICIVLLLLLLLSEVFLATPFQRNAVCHPVSGAEGDVMLRTLARGSSFFFFFFSMIHDPPVEKLPKPLPPVPPPPPPAVHPVSFGRESERRRAGR